VSDEQEKAWIYWDLDKIGIPWGFLLEPLGRSKKGKGFRTSW